jgi:hypothetical protein
VREKESCRTAGGTCASRGERRGDVAAVATALPGRRLQRTRDYRDDDAEPTPARTGEPTESQSFRGLYLNLHYASRRDLVAVYNI